MFSTPAPLWLAGGYSPGQDRRVGLCIVLFSERRAPLQSDRKLFRLSAAVVICFGGVYLFVCFDRV